MPEMAADLIFAVYGEIEGSAQRLGLFWFMGDKMEAKRGFSGFAGINAGILADASQLDISVFSVYYIISYV